MWWLTRLRNIVTWLWYYIFELKKKYIQLLNEAKKNIQNQNCKRFIDVVGIINIVLYYKFKKKFHSKFFYTEKH